MYLCFYYDPAHEVRCEIFYLWHYVSPQIVSDFGAFWIFTLRMLSVYLFKTKISKYFSGKLYEANTMVISSSESLLRSAPPPFSSYPSSYNFGNLKAFLYFSLFFLLWMISLFQGRTIFSLLCFLCLETPCPASKLVVT